MNQQPTRTPVTIGVGAAGHGRETGLAEAAHDLEHKTNGHDGSHPSCRACGYVRMLGAARAVREVPDAFTR